MKHILIALAFVAATGASAQPTAAEAARRDSDPALNGHVRDIRPTVEEQAAVAARRDTDPAVNGRVADVKKPPKKTVTAKR